ncbi:alkB, alkylation repair 4 [Chamberlinius hualienensis]
MEMDRKCGCKGMRSCLVCETADRTKEMKEKLQFEATSFVVCPRCRSVAVGWEVRSDDHECFHSETPPPVDIQEVMTGIQIIQDFVKSDEEQTLLTNMEQFPWTQSQSGRVKQDFGPKVNFKKQKIRLESFEGFPKYMHFVSERFKDVQFLQDFRPVELCNLRYIPERGSAIDPHLDDNWLWGPRLVTLNLASATVITLLSPPTNSDDGIARNLWEHAIFREDIKSLRVAITWRELSREFTFGGQQESLGTQLLNRAQHVIDTPCHR